MESRKFVTAQTIKIAVGEVVLTGCMFLVFAVLKAFDVKVLMGGLAGSILAVANFVIMALGASKAADKAESQNVTEGKTLMTASYIARSIAIFAVLFVLAKTGICNPIASVLPLVFVQPIIIVSELIKKKAG